ncbi:hypothetical protein [Chitinophaga nivalis]|uniref:Class I lanthipeptide n=1 Tax=Chitinophaga nivalis TaxID=2991709 RepID=A0ABT3II09_9BACT|nr:hypothetical protein [Chitinophaga nivalis]MCW3466725.1 hypothetical protein [Chitinophaga nivalis]MCW3483584.1 hypothetical protein [Chitinophaga nivalis]
MKKAPAKKLILSKVTVSNLSLANADAANEKLPTINGGCSMLRCTPPSTKVC